MSKRQLVLDKATSQIGNPAPDTYWADVLAAYRPGGQKGLAWCGAFALWCLRQAGVTTRLWRLGLGFLSVAPALKQTLDPKTGDVAYFDRPFQHHAIVDRIEGDTLYTVDGNQGAPQTVRAKARRLVPVDAVQRALTTHGHPLKDDNDLGPKTLAALKAFQFAMGPAFTSGVVDLATIKALGLKPTAIFFSIEAWIK